MHQRHFHQQSFVHSISWVTNKVNMIEYGQCKVKCYQHIKYSGNWGRILDNELLQWEHSRFQTTSNYTSAACGPAALFIFNLSCLQPINARTLQCFHFFVCFSIDRDRAREDSGKKSSWIKHLSSRGIFVSSCQNPNVLWRDNSIFHWGFDRGSQQAFYVCCQKQFFPHSLASAPLSILFRSRFFLRNSWQIWDVYCSTLYSNKIMN